jgi:hypothetical protein
MRKVTCGTLLLLWGLATGTGHGLCAEPVVNAPATPALPEFTPAAIVSTAPVSVTLSAKAGVVRYTVDGSEPTVKSPVSSGPVRINATTRVTARVFEGARPLGPVRSQTYVLIDKSLGRFTGDLPLVLIHTFGRTIERHAKQPAAVRFIDTRDGRASLTGAADFDSGGLISYRGNSSLRYLKRSYAFKALDDAGKALDAPVLGFPADSDWVLYGPYPDKTLMRDVLAYEMFRQMGHYASRTKFVEVFVNEGRGRLTERHYMGVFVLEEKIKRGPSRLALQKLGTNDNAEPNISGGYVFKKDHPDRTEDVEPTEDGAPHFGGTMAGVKPGYPSGPGGFPADPRGFLSSGSTRSGNRTTFRSSTAQPSPNAGERSLTERLAGLFRSGPPQRNAANRASPQPMPGYFAREFSPGFGEAESGEQFFVTARHNQFFFIEPKQEDITPAQKRWLLNHLDEFEHALYGPDFRDPVRGYAAYLDVDTFIDQHLIVEVTKNIDGFRFSTFFAKDRGGKIRMEPIWDWNLSFGNANGKQGWIAEYWYWPQLDDQQYSWFRRLFEDPDFGQRYVDRWGQLRTNLFSTARVHARIDSLARQLDEAQRRNFERWPILGKRIWPNNYVGRDYEDEVTWMKNWIARRLAWIDRQFVAGPTVTGPPATSQLTLGASEGQVYFTLDGTDPRQAGGGVSPKAQVFSSPVKLPARSRLFARTRVENRWSPPTRCEF